ncbi:MAG: type III-B CRISPR module-associated protein Cmr5, partial [Anaerolinea sp.]|nr:type III-B CRISPR module-associated protein Cmr5 [Anaerolinea sp.]
AAASLLSAGCNGCKRTGVNTMTSASKPTQQTLQQRRAAHAWNAVEDVQKNHSKDKGKYGSLMRGLPALIQTDGLGQTLAFLMAKSKSEASHGIAFKQISDWVTQELKAQDTDLFQYLLKSSTAVYRQATTETLAYLQWIKRFVEAKGWKSEGD